MCVLKKERVYNPRIISLVNGTKGFVTVQKTEVGIICRGTAEILQKD